MSRIRALFALLVVAFADRKSTRLNSSHDQISYAVFCLKKKKNKNTTNSGESTKLTQTAKKPPPITSNSTPTTTRHQVLEHLPSRTHTYTKPQWTYIDS